MIDVAVKQGKSERSGTVLDNVGPEIGKSYPFRQGRAVGDEAAHAGSEEAGRGLEALGGGREGEGRGD